MEALSRKIRSWFVIKQLVDDQSMVLETTPSDLHNVVYRCSIIN